MVAKFSAPIQTGPWGPPSLVCNGYRVSFSVVKRPGRGFDHPTSSSAEVKERIELNFYTPSGFSGSLLRRTLPFDFDSKLLPWNEH